MALLTIFLTIIALYALLGLLFGVFYALRIAPARDPVAAAAPLRVRCLFILGAIALWPILLLPGSERQRSPANSDDSHGARP